jgi:hypothetical protein
VVVGCRKGGQDRHEVVTCLEASIGVQH